MKVEGEPKLVRIAHNRKDETSFGIAAQRAHPLVQRRRAMFQQPSNYDRNAFPPSLTYASVFLAALFVGVILFETFAATLNA
jgi:hypothetical protein